MHGTGVSLRTRNMAACCCCAGCCVACCVACGCAASCWAGAAEGTGGVAAAGCCQRCAAAGSRLKAAYRPVSWARGAKGLLAGRDRSIRWRRVQGHRGWVDAGLITCLQCGGHVLGAGWAGLRTRPPALAPGWTKSISRPLRAPRSNSSSPSPHTHAPR